MRYLLIVGCIALAQLGSQPAQAATPDAIRAAHREAARKAMSVLESGATLKGTVQQNGSAGRFEAYFYQGSWLVREVFGEMTSESYSGADGDWAGSNYSLPYQILPEDNPANTVLNLLSNGTYLEDPYWDKFTYISEEAGAYHCQLALDNLPVVDVLLYSDEDDPGYMQIMSATVSLAPQDPHAIRHRSFYYYSKDAQGRLYTSRETGKELDDTDHEVDFSDYTVTEFDVLGHKPDGLKFNTARTPVGNPGAKLTAPVVVPAVTNFGYYIVPVTFASGTTLNFILDTGASASLFSPAAVAAAGLETNLITTAHGHGTRLNFEIGMVSGASLGTPGNSVPLAPFPATKIEESSRDVLQAMASYNAAGIIGIAPLDQYVVTLDHDGKSITLTPPQIFDPKKQLPGPFLTYTLDVEDLVYTKARINDTLVGQIALDTGLQQDLALLTETMDGAGMQFEKVGTARNTVVGGSKDFDFVKVQSFDLGPLRMVGKIASLTGDDRGTLTARKMLGFLGLSLFTQARVTLDLFNQRMYVEPPEAIVKQMPPQLFEGLADDLFQPPPATGSGVLHPFGGPPSKLDDGTGEAPPAAPAPPAPPAQPDAPSTPAPGSAASRAA